MFGKLNNCMINIYTVGVFKNPFSGIIDKISKKVGKSVTKKTKKWYNPKSWFSSTNKQGVAAQKTTTNILNYLIIIVVVIIVLVILSKLLSRKKRKGNGGEVNVNVSSSSGTPTEPRPQPPASQDKGIQKF